MILALAVDGLRAFPLVVDPWPVRAVKRRVSEAEGSEGGPPVVDIFTAFPVGEGGPLAVDEVKSQHHKELDPQKDSMPLPKNHRLTPTARALRKRMTKQERHLWYDFLRDYKVQFNRQKVIGKFIVDFYCHAAQLVVEIDGGQHFNAAQLQHDTERTSILNSYGIEVLRFTNYEIDNNFFEVCMKIKEKVEID